MAVETFRYISDYVPGVSNRLILIRRPAPQTAGVGSDRVGSAPQELVFLELDPGSRLKLDYR